MSNVERGASNGATRTIFISVAGAILSGAVVQLAAAIWWGASMMIRLEGVELRSKENLAMILRLEERGFRGIPVLEQQIRDLREQQSELQTHVRSGSTDIQRIILMEERIRINIERLSEIDRILQERFKTISDAEVRTRLQDEHFKMHEQQLRALSDKLIELDARINGHVYDPFGQHRPNPPPVLAPPQRNRK